MLIKEKKKSPTKLCCFGYCYITFYPLENNSEKLLGQTGTIWLSRWELVGLKGEQCC